METLPDGTKRSRRQIKGPIKFIPQDMSPEQQNLQKEIRYIQMVTITCLNGLFNVWNINTSGNLPNLFSNPNLPKVGIDVQY